jgi:hypothetical protein
MQVFFMKLQLLQLRLLPLLISVTGCNRSSRWYTDAAMYKIRIRTTDSYRLNLEKL